jgi:hypothetical protein
LVDAKSGDTNCSIAVQIVGEFDDATAGHGFLKDGATYTTIDVRGALTTQAFGTNNAGQIVEWSVDPCLQVPGFVATPTPVPEPANWLPFVSGLAGLIWCRKRTSGLS